MTPLLALLFACGTEPGPPPPPPPPPDAVATTAARLAASEGGRLLAQAIEAHGGLERWQATESLRFTFDYQPEGRPEARMHTVNHVHVPTSRARQEAVGGDAVFGWDGTQAWIAPDEAAFPRPARFWALTPYYFVAMPFVLADPGTRHERLPDAPLDGVTMERVKVTYEAGTGDAPDDYYVAWLHPESHRLTALTYIVSSPELFPDGGQSGEKRLAWVATAAVDGLVLPTRLEGWHLDADGAPDRPSAGVDVSGLARNEALTDDAFVPVPGAVTGL